MLCNQNLYTSTVVELCNPNIHFNRFRFTEDSLDIHIACSHVRSWFLFVESLQSHIHDGCKFETWPCKRRFGSYAAGSCFPPEESITSPELGYAADHGPTGLYYLPTRAEPPYCGYPLRASVKVADVELRPKGVLSVRLEHGATWTNFKILCEWVASLKILKCINEENSIWYVQLLFFFSQSALPPLSSLNNRNNPQPTFYDVRAADFGAFHANVTEIELYIKFEAMIPENKPPEVEYTEILLVNKISLEDRRGHRWERRTIYISIISRILNSEERNERNLFFRWELCNLNLHVGLKEETLTLKSQKCS